MAQYPLRQNRSAASSSQAVPIEGLHEESSVVLTGCKMQKGSSVVAETTKFLSESVDLTL